MDMRRTSRARHSYAAGLLAVLMWCAHPVGSPAQTPETLAAAERLFAVQDFEAMMLDLVKKISVQLPEHLQSSYVSEMTQPQFMGRLKDATKAAMVKHFEVQELNSLADFYSTPIAKSAMAKMGNYMAELMPFLQTEMVQVAQRIMQQGVPAKK